MYFCVNVKDAVDASERSIEALGMEISDFNKGNIKARERMVAQYAIAGQTVCAVIGQNHAAESVTGFYTKFGDGAADILHYGVLINVKAVRCYKYWVLQTIYT